eukprot:CAMPEP_0178781304 /NCGR_PEP_ID=MMETSP0745-20121128/2529_1 /TAXON_ID=913974 /ORGANISM="Nitzschia punctata, Strain CCMP561" /LENGTH=411 /DNA_ID=CAMNT_0020438637 /DNA_START=60 /DNA_END=1295 /DNA_ORIENTATION=-
MGTIDENQTFFNIGDGTNLDNSYSQIVMYGGSESNTWLHGFENGFDESGGKGYFDVVLLEPFDGNCSGTNTADPTAVSFFTEESFAPTGKYTSQGSLNLHIGLSVGAWQGTNHEIDGNFGFCCVVRKFLSVDGSNDLLMNEQKVFFSVAIGSTSFDSGAYQTAELGGEESVLANSTVGSVEARIANSPVAVGGRLGLFVFARGSFKIANLANVEMRIGVDPVPQEDDIVVPLVDEFGSASSVLTVLSGYGEQRVDLAHLMQRSYFGPVQKYLRVSGDAITYLGADRRSLETHRVLEPGLEEQLHHQHFSLTGLLAAIEVNTPLDVDNMGTATNEVTKVASGVVVTSVVIGFLAVVTTIALVLYCRRLRSRHNAIASGSALTAPSLDEGRCSSLSWKETSSETDFADEEDGN